MFASSFDIVGHLQTSRSFIELCLWRLLATAFGSYFHILSNVRLSPWHSFSSIDCALACTMNGGNNLHSHWITLALTLNFECQSPSSLSLRELSLVSVSSFSLCGSCTDSFFSPFRFDCIPSSSGIASQKALQHFHPRRHTLHF